MGSYTDYYSKERLSRRMKAAEVSPLSEKEFKNRLEDGSPDVGLFNRGEGLKTVSGPPRCRWTRRDAQEANGGHQPL
jgi:hypothetical protein